MNDPGKNIFAWHGWRLALLRSWNPVRIEGDWDRGSVLFADIGAARLALRWQKVGRRFNPTEWSSRTLRQEVGQLAAKEARKVPVTGLEEPMLYLEPQPPGRDVFLAFSPNSGRACQIIYHSRRRDSVLEKQILPALVDSAPGDAQAWSLFDLACMPPPGFRLIEHRLLAGDLALTFAHQKDRLTIRQITPASLALSRRSLVDWLADQQRALLPHYQVVGNLREIEHGFARDAQKLARFVLHRHLPRVMFSVALHDAQRDRLLLVDGSRADLVEALSRSAWGRD